MELEAFYGSRWIEKSRCWNEKPDPEMFFDEEREEEAKKYCSFCPVAAECIGLANRTDSRGIWGGKNYISRRKQLAFQDKRLAELQEQLKRLQQGRIDPNAA